MLGSRKWLSLALGAACGFLLSRLVPDEWPWWQELLVLLAVILVVYGVQRCGTALRKRQIPA